MSMTLNELKDRAAELFEDPANVEFYVYNSKWDTVIVTDGTKRYEVSRCAAFSSIDDTTGIRSVIAASEIPVAQMIPTPRQLPL